MSVEQKDDEVRYNFKCRRQLREDAKRNTERGELADMGRQMLRRAAYGMSGEQDTELSKAKAELQEVRDRIDDLRRDRRQIDAEIESQESRASRLEERVSKLEERREKHKSTLDTLENMLRGGERMWPVRVKNAADVDVDTAHELFERLREENDDLPECAFTEPGIETPTDWREVAEEYTIQERA